MMCTNNPAAQVVRDSFQFLLSVQCVEEKTWDTLHTLASYLAGVGLAFEDLSDFLGGYSEEPCH